MSIATAIQNAQQKVADAYTAISNKGGTLPATQNLSNMPTAIASIPSGGTATIDPLSITPTTSQQVISATSGVDGYAPITVVAVTSAIDNNIVATNIKSGSSILGVNGSVVELQGETRTVTPTTSQQTITPTSGKNGITSVTVNAVTSSIDANIVAGNIKKDVIILGVTGTHEGGGGTDNLPAFISDGISSISDSTITSIRPYAFQNNNSTYVTNPISSISCSNVTSVGDYAFHSASSLQTASFPSLTTLGEYAFYGCNSLTGFTIPSTLNTIKTYTFYNCKGFTSLTIPSNVTSVESSAFSGCTNMEELNYNATNATFPSGQNSVFNNMGKDKNNFVLNIGNNVEVIPISFLYSSSSTSSLPNIKTINISSNNSITKIGQYAFYRCGALTSVSFPSITSVTESSQYAFQNCSNLTSVSFPNLQSITIDNGFYNIFSGCSSLTTIDLSSLSSIATKQALRRAFYNCTSLQSVSFPALTSSSFGSYTNQFNTMLSGVTGCTVHFPSNLQSVIGSWSDVTAGFGGTSTTVLFDLTATN